MCSRISYFLSSIFPSSLTNISSPHTAFLASFHVHLSLVGSVPFLPSHLTHCPREPRLTLSEGKQVALFAEPVPVLVIVSLSTLSPCLSLAWVISPRGRSSALSPP